MLKAYIQWPNSGNTLLPTRLCTINFIQAEECKFTLSMGLVFSENCVRIFQPCRITEQISNYMTDNVENFWRLVMNIRGPALTGSSGNQSILSSWLLARPEDWLAARWRELSMEIYAWTQSCQFEMMDPGNWHFDHEGVSYQGFFIVE